MVEAESLDSSQRLVIEPATRAFQQFLDGRAVDRLMEALPVGWRWGWLSRWGDAWHIGVIGKPERHACSCPEHTGHSGKSEAVTGKGATVSEAADAARAALEARE